MLELYHTIIYEPLLNLLVWGYNSLPGHDVGIVIVVLTLLVRLVLAPTMHKQIKSQQAMTRLQPHIDALKEKHKDDKEAHAKAVMELYKEHKVNPFSSCLPLLIQLPILIALYQVFDKALRGNLDGLYRAVHNPGIIDPYFLSVVNLAEPNIILAILAGAFQFWQGRMMQAKTSKSTDATAKAIQMQTMYLLPLVSIFIAWRLPAGLPLYWIVTTLFAIAQQYYIMRKHSAEQNVVNP
jgi:YidC/Oxa1 family membrane protein insertase